MNKKEKILKNPELRNKSKELKGFEDVIDLIPGRFKSGPKTNPKMHDDFQLLNLLEYELNRLKKLEVFLGHKLDLFEKFNQIDHLIKKNEEQNRIDIKKIIDLNLSKHTDFHRQLNKLFSSTFR